MENITIVDSNVNRKEKYEATGLADIFLKLEALDTAEKKEYSYNTNIDKLISILLKRKNIYLVEDNENGITVELTQAGDFGSYIKTGLVKISAVKTKRLFFVAPATKDILLGCHKYIFPQYNMEIPATLEDLNMLNYADFTNTYWLDLSANYMESKINVIEPKKKTLVFQDLLEILPIKIDETCIFILFKFFRKFFIHYLTQKTKIYDDFLARIDFCFFLNAKKKEEESNNIWNAICARICKMLDIPMTTTFTNKEKSLLKKRNDIFNFFIPTCNHNHYSKDLVLNGDFYVCSHGNNIRCIHYDYKNGIEVEKKFGENILSTKLTCRICGAELRRDPEYTKIKHSLISNKDHDSELRSYIFKKTLGALQDIEFLVLVSDDYIKQLSGNISYTIYPYISRYYEKLERMKGINKEEVGSMKEIVAILYIYAGLLLLVSGNQKIMSFKGVSTREKDIAIANKKFVLFRVEKILHFYINKIKDFKTINLSNSFQTILDDINGKVIKSPREFTRYNIKETILYKYFEFKGYDVSVFPKLVAKPGNHINNKIDIIFINLLLQDKFIGKPVKDVLEFSEKFVAWQENLKKIKQESIQYLMSKNIYFRFDKKYFPNPYIAYDRKYISWTYGINHKHNWIIAKTNKRETDISQIGLDEYIEFLKCSVCGIKNSSVGPENYNDYIESLSIDRYYEYYCPVSTFHKKPCKDCGYGTNKFNYKLPVKKIQLPIKSLIIEKVAEKKKINFVPPVYVGNMPKQQYSNFWNNLFCNEDVTFRELLDGKKSNELTAVPKILMLYANLVTLLSKIVNIHNMPNKQLQSFIGEEKLLVSLIKEINLLRAEKINPTFEYLRNNFILIFNKLPKPLAEFYFKELYKSVENSSLSEENIKAAALINHKQKLVHDGEITEENEKNENGFNYDGFDYDGRNEEIS